MRAVFDRTSDLERAGRDHVLRFPRTVTASHLIDLAEGAGACTLALEVPLGDTLPGNLPHWFATQIQHALLTAFPAWLPGAESIDRVTAGGAQALAALAEDLAGRSDVFGPFVAAAATAAVRGREDLLGFPLETIVRESQQLLSRAFKSDYVIVIMDVSGQAGEFERVALEQGVAWLASQAAFRVWLHGEGVDLLERFATSDDLPHTRPVKPSVGPLTYITPAAGFPAPTSECERRLEAYLRGQIWAAGRAWNQSWSGDAAANPIRVDLLWAAECLVVELDGDEHRQSWKYEADRRRDRRLQAAGFQILRFTNAELERDIVLVASEIERLLTRIRERV
jgi:very-short-patch-repair endonuclease